MRRYRDGVRAIASSAGEGGQPDHARVSTAATKLPQTPSEDTKSGKGK